MQTPPEHRPLQHAWEVAHGHPAAQHTPRSGFSQSGSHDAADAGLGALMVVTSGSAMTIA